MRTLHWHRRDLRTTDDRALDAAAAAGEAIPAFVLDPGVLEHASPPRVAFMLDSLAGLRARYRDLGGDLLVATGDPREELPRLAAEHGAERVAWNRDYSGLARERDGAVRERLEGSGVEVESFHDALLHEPGSITTEAGETYSVYSYFRRKWADREKPVPVPEPDADRLAGVEGEALPTLDDLGFEAPEADVPAGGMDAARERLEAFVSGPIYRYAEERDVPASDATSRLSPHLKWGTVGVREVWEAVERAREGATDEGAVESCEEFAAQLAWREFYAHVLAANPSVVTEDYREYPNPIEWRDDPEGLRAWKDGETGYPIVDAGMRQLREEAWMHNRVRMIVASFLTKDLLIDWREGYAWFREKLADHDAANDSGGWQWAASTGTDAQPYFRIFNPATQCERHDPEGEYVREHVPELRDAPTEAIHSWDELDPEERRRVAPGYPDPIVDHATRRDEALATFEAARDE